MDQQVKICPHCQTLNEPDYVYCKRCGATLGPQQSQNAAQTNGADTQPGSGSAPGYGSQPGYNAQQPAYNYSAPVGAATIDGIPAEQVDAFVGTGASLKQKIHKMEMANSKTSWNWPVFLTTLFGGMLLTPCWFFHRKMNKLASLLLAVGIAFTALSVVTVMPILDATVDMAEDLIEYENSPWGYHYSDDNTVWKHSYPTDAEEQIVLDYMQKISGSLTMGMLLNLIQLAYAIVMSLFANYLYKRHVTNTIRTLSAQPGRTAQDILAARGGTSVVGWLILGAGVLVLFIAGVFFIMQYLLSQIIPLLP